MKYIALLRGINVGGNNKVSMAELKTCFENVGHLNVLTYINSGNVIFESDKTDKVELVKECEEVIEKQFGFHVVCSVITAKELYAALKNAPAWWGKNDDKHNALFVIAPATAKDIVEEVGEAKPEYETIAMHEPIIFWSAPLKTFGRTRYSKIVGTKAYQSITIRNANTTKKLAELTT
ncbi:MAG: DUF1697 domain-containing protein [Patescibacteria group bacterium]